MRRMLPPQQITETERENGSNAYLMTLVAAIAGLPLPIINLIACIIFAFSIKRKSDFVRFHILQATVSQLCLVAMNSVLFTWTLRIIFTDLQVSASWAGYLFAAVFINLLDYISNIRAAIAARKGQHYFMSFFGWLSWVIVYSKKPRSADETEDDSPAAPKAILQLIILIALFIGVFTAVRYLSPAYLPRTSWLSVENETKLGREMTTLMLSDEQQVYSDAGRNLMDTINARLSKANAPSEYRYHIYIVKKNDVNALTLPGGNIIVFTGLIDEADTPDEIAAVIAHEAGHVEHRHVVTRLIRELGLSAVISATGSGHGAVVRKFLSSALSNTFSRSQEREADVAALRTLEKAQIDPVSLGTFFRRLSAKHEDQNPELNEFFSTHPSDASRVEQAFAFRTHPGFVSSPLPVDDFDRLKQEIEMHDGE